MFTFRKIDDKNYWFLRCCEIIKKFSKRSIPISSVHSITGHLGIGINNDSQFFVFDNVSKPTILDVIKNRPNIIDEVLGEIQIDLEGKRDILSEKKAKARSIRAPDEPEKGERKFMKSFAHKFKKFFKTNTSSGPGVPTTPMIPTPVGNPNVENVKIPKNAATMTPSIAENNHGNIYRYPFSELFGISLRKKGDNFLRTCFVRERNVTRFFAFERTGIVHIWTYSKENLAWVHAGSEVIVPRVVLTKRMYKRSGKYIISDKEKRRNEDEEPEVKILDMQYLQNSSVFAASLSDGRVVYRVVLISTKMARIPFGEKKPVTIESYKLMRDVLVLDLVPQLLAAEGSKRVGDDLYFKRKTIEDGEKVLDYLRIEESKDGMWVFTGHKVLHLAIAASMLAPRSIPISRIRAVHVKNIQMYEKDLPGKSENAKDILFYVALRVHPISLEMVLLGIDGIVYVVEICGGNKTLHRLRRICRRSPIGDVEKLKVMIDYRQFYNFCRSKRRVVLDELLKMKPVEFFFVHNNILCVVTNNKLVVTEPKSNTVIYECLLPNEIILQRSSLSIMPSTAGGKIIQSQTSLFQVYRDKTTKECTLNFGVFSSSNAYVLISPNLNQLMQFSSKRIKENEKAKSPASNFSIEDVGIEKTEDLMILAETAKEWGLNGWETLFLLEIIIETSSPKRQQRKLEGKKDDENEFTVERKVELFDRLLLKLENPSLVWNSTRSISEQKKILKRVCSFVKNFPTPTNKFWKSKRSRRTFYSGGLGSRKGKREINWTVFYNEIDSSPIDVTEVYENLTPLNLTLAPNISKSLFLSKMLIDEMQFELDKKIAKEEEEKKIEESEMNDNNQFVIDEKVSDFCLLEMSDKHPEEIFDHLCESYGLYVVKSQSLKTGKVFHKEEVISFEDIFNLRSVVEGADTHSINSSLIRDDVDIFFFKNFQSPMTPPSPQPYASLMGQQTGDKGNELNLTFEILSKILFFSYEKQPNLLCLLILLMEKEKRTILERKKARMESNFNVRMSPSKRKHNENENFGLRVRFSKNYSGIFSRKALEFLEQHSSLKEKLKENSLTVNQTFMLVQLYIWMDELLKAVDLLIRTYEYEACRKVIEECYIKKENGIVHYELIALITKYCIEKNNLNRSKYLSPILKRIIPKGQFNMLNFVELFPLEEKTDDMEVTEGEKSNGVGLDLFSLFVK